MLPFNVPKKFVYVAAVPAAFPERVASTNKKTAVPAVPEYTFEPAAVVAFGINLNLPSVSLNPKKPVVAVPALDHLNSIPLSWLLSKVE